jgi:hypothetical protein
VDRRHVVAPALLGWYLLMPPGTKTGGWDASASLSKWNHVSSHDSAKECEQAKEELGKAQPGTTEEEHRASVRAHNWAFDAECIATNDPRLAK